MIVGGIFPPILSYVLSVVTFYRWHYKIRM